MKARKTTFPYERNRIKTIEEMQKSALIGRPHRKQAIVLYRIMERRQTVLSYIQLSSSTLVYSIEILRSRNSTRHALYKRKNMNKISVQRTVNKKARIKKKISVIKRRY